MATLKGLKIRSVKDRVKGVQITKPIVYGTTAHRLEEATREGYTHGWKVYLRSHENEDLSVFVQAVHFQLHKTFKNPLKIVTEPPYEVDEVGYGEFPIYITIYFRDPRENSVTIEHFLKLEPGQGEERSPGGSVTSEFYDEIDFQDPSSFLYSLLTNPKMLTEENVRPLDYSKKGQEDLNTAMQANQTVKKSLAETIIQVTELRAKITECHSAIEEKRAKLAEATADFSRVMPKGTASCKD